MELYIIRHGETDLNAKGFLQGWLDEPLNENGRRLAVETGQALKGVRFDACISSPLSRAKETAELFLKENGSTCTIQYDPRIREIFCGKFEGRPLKDMGEPGRYYFTDPFRFDGFPEGENIYDVCARTQEFLEELAGKDLGEKVLISTHGCALRAMLNRLYENPRDFWQGHVPYNCCISIVEAGNGKLRLLEKDRIFYSEKDITDYYR